MVSAMFREDTETTEKPLQRIAPSIGMILIRPDMLHATPMFETYISSRYVLLEKQTLPMDAESYWHIYKHDFYRPETMHCRLTRAALYIGSPCCLMIFEDQAHTNEDEPVSDYLRNSLKGSQGTYQPGTLRGDIVYRNALRLGFHDLESVYTDERVKYAVDPFGAYQTLASMTTDEAVRSLPYPILFYTGVGVHVPDSSEIDTDMPKLLARVTEVSSYAPESCS